MHPHKRINTGIEAVVFLKYVDSDRIFIKVMAFNGLVNKECQQLTEFVRTDKTLARQYFLDLVSDRGGGRALWLSAKVGPHVLSKTGPTL